MFPIMASLTANSKCVIYECNMFIVRPHAFTLTEFIEMEGDDSVDLTSLF